MPSQRGADRAWVGAVPIRGDPVGYHAGGRLGGAEERLGRRHVPVLAEHGVDQIAVAAPDLQVGFVHVRHASPDDVAGVLRSGQVRVFLPIRGRSRD
jgi:hypothetical protein